MTSEHPPHDQVELLLDAADHGVDDVASVIDTIGARETASTLVSEIVFRARLDELVASDEAASLIIVLRHGGHEITTQVSAGPHGVTIGENERVTLAPTRIAQSMCEVVLSLYGPRERVSASTREIRWPSADYVVPRLGDNPLPLAFHAIVQRVIRVLDRGEPTDLTELAVRYGTDKWGVMHQYTPHYHRHFDHLRERKLTVLEIGVGGYDDPHRGGGSLKMWKHYFPRATIYGLDLSDKRHFDEDRIVTVQADQSDSARLRQLAEQIGPFDIVIDDGSHVSPHVIASFKTLFPYLRPEGVYVIEDLHGSYWPMLFEGSEEDLNDPAYTVGFLKTLVDGLHHEEFLDPATRDPQPTDTTLRGVHFYHNLVILEKGMNREGSPIAEVLRRSTRRHA